MACCADSFAPQIVWRGTFLEVVEGGATNSRATRPRSLTDSCSEATTSFLEERKTAKHLAARLQDIWESHSQRGHLCDDDFASSYDLSVADLESCDFIRSVTYTGDVKCSQTSERASGKAKRVRSMASRSTRTTGSEVTPAESDDVSEVPVWQQLQQSSRSFSNLVLGAIQTSSVSPEPWVCPSKGIRMEVQSQMREKFESIRTLQHSRPVSAALEVIDEIPDELRETLEESTRKLADKIYDEVTAMGRIIRESEAANVDSCIERLYMIPDLFLSYLEDSFCRVRSVVREHVDGIMTAFGEEGITPDQIIAHLQNIPQEVKKICFETVAEVLQQPKRQAIAIVDQALRCAAQGSLCEERKNELARLSSNIAEYPETFPFVPAAVESVTSAVDRALAVVSDKTDVRELFPMNRVVADTLLRAKYGRDNVPEWSETDNRAVGMGRGAVTVRKEPGPYVFRAEVSPDDKIQQDSSDCVSLATADPLEQPLAPGATLPSPGSAWHPELCSRPCLYFAQGKCANGSGCKFCHLPHHRIKTMNLDKRHRSTMKQLGIRQCVLLALPILKDKVQALKLAPEAQPGLHVVDFRDLKRRLSDLELVAQHLPASSVTLRRAEADAQRTLTRALGAVSTRTLLTTLYRSLPAEHQYADVAEALKRSMASAGILDETLPSNASDHPDRLR